MNYLLYIFKQRYMHNIRVVDVIFAYV